jgi:hypothetical protein
MHITDCWKGERCVWQMKTRLWDCLCVRVGQRDTRSQPLFPLSLTATNSTSFAGSLNTPVSFRLLPSQQYTGKWSLLILARSLPLDIFKQIPFFVNCISSYFETKCQRKRRVKERRLKSRNYARKRSVLAKK